MTLLNIGFWVDNIFPLSILITMFHHFLTHKISNKKSVFLSLERQLHMLDYLILYHRVGYSILVHLSFSLPLLLPPVPLFFSFLFLSWDNFGWTITKFMDSSLSYMQSTDMSVERIFSDIKLLFIAFLLDIFNSFHLPAKMPHLFTYVIKLFH